MPNAAQALVEILHRNGIDRVFCVPGESFLGIMDALHDSPIDVVTARHEASAGFMAVADARLTARPGVLLVSRGPGATNAAIALHTAEQDAVPLILIVGQIEKKDLRREAFQEIDYGRMYGGIAKWVAEAIDAEQVPELTAKAVRIATSGTPGPVVLVVPEDLQFPEAPMPAGVVQQRRPSVPAPGDVAEVRALLEKAQRPLIIAGGGLDVPGGREALLAFAERWNVPVAVSFRRQDLFPNAHPLYAGDLGLANPKQQIAAFQDSDLILALGTRLGDITTQNYSFPDYPRPRQALVHCHDDSRIIGQHFIADVGIAASPKALAEALADGTALPARDWSGMVRALYEDYATWTVKAAPDGVVFGNVVHALNEVLEEDGIVVADAGTLSSHVYRHVPFRHPQRLLAPISGAMGYGVPGAVAAALRHPGRQVICLVGDGGFMMTGSEFMTAVARQLPLLILLSNNSSYASIRIHQERHYPGRVVATDLVNPDFAALARAYGAAGYSIEREEDIRPVLREAVQATGPRLVEVKASLETYLPATVSRANAAD
ncbi:MULTISPECIES: thiamine pyrophosphate-dependent enzyme [Oceanibaculum]|uniref:Acetolactate synthase-1/2/3 large subunit n=1 Tax=Oceanibaculum indicum TaxID=526216 RepID=A0A420WP76_9PROT|nr:MULTISPECIES: thiamine pyrophosphate-dependent enzyme [Oceanibaculum]MCH2394890.1 thiamine pyrophosphate-dependent enzyme [Oceanibaculum sp.]RKQ72665.1 acetolactate synthase-1/2/3 large subunit [Oceanibaculum indicum]